MKFAEFKINSFVQLEQVTGDATYTVLNTVENYEGSGGGTVEQRRYDGYTSAIWCRPGVQGDPTGPGLPAPY
ncbi:MAG: hypothetical protein KDC52_17420 [Ignavibacteriae bacterium]|jgi:hypothetical protein|nr:hypothetical protein [Saprospiraceae bacterium]MCB0753255.1 hypothetical protein [Ignavibacteriota bacterium]MCO5278771.1 hypothetical protein [Saprospiraceae bacterium]